MAHKTSPPELNESDDTRLRILDAAEDVFAEKGFEAATTREICERAHVKNVGAVNYYFQGKERLYAEAVKYAMRSCAKDVPIPEWPKGTPPEHKLRDFIRMMLGRLL
jgi:AcrR family transcriptional regulator